MNRLILADFYKVSRRNLYFVMLIVLSALAVTLVLAVLRGRNAGTVTGAFDVAPQMLQYPLAILPILTQMTIGEEYHERTLKNTIEYGTVRNRYYVSKLITTIILGAVLMVVVYTAYFCAALIVLPDGEGVSSTLAGNTFACIGSAFTIYSAAAAMSLFLLTVFNKSVMSIFIYYGAVYVSDLLLKLFDLKQLSILLLNRQISLLTGEGPDFKAALMVSAVTFTVFLICGFITLKRKDLA